MDIEQMRRDAEAPVKADAASAESVSRDLAVDDPLFNWFSRADARRDPARLNFFRFLPSGETRPHQPTPPGAAGPRMWAMWREAAGGGG